MDSLSTNDLLCHLEQGTIEMEGYVPWGSNYTFVIKVVHEGDEIEAVYKPRQGERPLWDFPSGTLCSRELAAYLVSEALGWHVVPPTILRDGPHGWGSFQFFIDHDPDEHYFTFKDENSDDLEFQLKVIALFDLITNNADRKGGHVIRDVNDKLWAIDHGITFHDEWKLRTVIWDFVGEPFDDELVLDLRKFSELLDKPSQLCQELSQLLSRREMTALQQRVRRLLKKPHFPNPGPGRPYPWPLI